MSRIILEERVHLNLNRGATMLLFLILVFSSLNTNLLMVSPNLESDIGLGYARHLVG